MLFREILSLPTLHNISNRHSPVSNKMYEVLPKTTLSELVAIFSQPNTAPKVRESVRFKGLILGASVQDVIETLGVPQHIAYQGEGRTIYEIFSYSEQIAGQSVVLQVHIIDDLFVAGTYWLNAEQIQLLSEIMPCVDFENQKIVSDVYNNMICVRSKAQYTALWFVTGDVRLRRRAEVPADAPFSFREIVGTLSSFLL